MLEVIHIDSGLGNQMLAYCVVMSMQMTNPQDEIYIETLVYDIPECNDVISQWNGYELEKVFGIQTSNVKTLFNENQWNNILTEVRKSEFWKKNWNYAPYITKALNGAGLNLENKRGDLENEQNVTKRGSIRNRIRAFFLDKTALGAYIRLLHRKNNFAKLSMQCAHPQRLFMKTESDIFTGMWLDFKFNGNRIEDIHDKIMKTFVFPPFIDKQNLRIANLLDTTNSVFIHARRGDMLSSNGWCYKYGYFKRAVNHIKENVKDPLFVFFTNTGSIEWCRKNADNIFGLNKEDKIMFVDWNAGEQSFRDMQLMTHCKHGIITNSTFGFWGAYLIQNPSKITISPMVEINTTYHC